MTRKIETYACEFCSRVYDTQDEAEKCERTYRALRPKFSIGDIVLGRAGFGWFNGDPAWISNPQVAAEQPPRPGGLSTKGSQPGHGNCFGDCCTYSFYYVVTHIDGDDRRHSFPHRVRYHVATKAMNGADGYRFGYTFDDGHINLRKVDDPPEYVAESSRDLIGVVAETLL